MGGPRSMGWSWALPKSALWSQPLPPWGLPRQLAFFPAPRMPEEPTSVGAVSGEALQLAHPALSTLRQQDG